MKNSTKKKCVWYLCWSLMTSVCGNFTWRLVVKVWRGINFSLSIWLTAWPCTFFSDLKTTLFTILLKMPWIPFLANIFGPKDLVVIFQNSQHFKYSGIKVMPMVKTVFHSAAVQNFTCLDYEGDFGLVTKPCYNHLVWGDHSIISRAPWPIRMLDFL